MKITQLTIYRIAISCAILFCITCWKATAQIGKTFSHYTWSFLCAESIYFYNDSIAFYDEGCENHAHFISMLKWKREGNIIACRAIEAGEQIALASVAKKKGNDCATEFLMYDIDGKAVEYEPVFIREEKDSTTIRTIWDEGFKNKCSYRTKRFNVMPLNVFPLYSEQLRMLPNSPFDTVIIHFNLPQMCLKPMEAKLWCYPEIRFSVYGENLFFESQIQDFWTSW